MPRTRMPVFEKRLKRCDRLNLGCRKLPMTCRYSLPRRLVCVILLTTSLKGVCGFGTTVIPGTGFGDTDSAREMNSSRNPTTFSVNDLLDGPFKIDLNHTLRDIVLDVTEFVCGTSKLCNATVEQKGKVCSYECSNCRCDDACYYYGDCCPDMTFVGPSTAVPSSPYVTCVSEPWTTWVHETTGVHEGSVLMVTLCPITSKLSEDVINRCERVDFHDETQATPVSDIHSKITYRNVYCAVCHSAKDTVPWTHSVTCESSATARRVTNKEHLWRALTNDHRCTFITFPSANVTLRPCTTRVTASCGDMPIVENDTLETLCRLYTHVLGDYTTSELKASYRNVFCALCNRAYFSVSPFCERRMPIKNTFPLSVVINFNPRSRDQSNDETTPQISDGLRKCSQHETKDPFSNDCRPLQCDQERVLTGGRCEPKFADITGLGFSFSAIVKQSDSKTKVFWDTFLSTYENALRRHLTAYSPFFFFPLVMSQYIKQTDDNKSFPVLAVEGKVVSKSEKRLDDMELTLREIASLSFTYIEQGENNTVHSVSVPCATTPHEMLSVDHVLQGNRTIQPRYTSLCYPLSLEECQANVEFSAIEEALNCPYLEYNLTEANFTYDPLNHTLTSENRVIPLNQSSYIDCGAVLKLCSDLLHNIEITSDQENSTTVTRGSSGITELETALTLVTFLSISLSLVGLFLTFLVYCTSPKLRTLPGKNNMALIFHLFCAQLIFEVGARRTSNAPLCQALGVLIHYFWLASFAWMAVCAYHMFKVFTNLLPVQHNSISERKKLLSFCIFSCVCPAMIILTCVIYHLVSSEGTDIGYGGVVCFLNRPEDIGIFFVSPLAAMVLFNAYCFVRTILAIRAVPDMTNASTKTNKHQAVVYFRLSVLFGFTWVFGILAAILQSDVLWFVFIILTGGQGLFIFIAYCVNRRTWETVKLGLRRKFSSRTISTSPSGNQDTPL